MVTAVSGFIEQVGQEFQNTIIIHQSPHNSIKLQRVTTDTCQQVYL